jgi:hypothetical protein
LEVDLVNLEVASVSLLNLSRHRAEVASVNLQMPLEVGEEPQAHLLVPLSPLQLEDSMHL